MRAFSTNEAKSSAHLCTFSSLHQKTHINVCKIKWIFCPLSTPTGCGALALLPPARRRPAHRQHHHVPGHSVAVRTVRRSERPACGRRRHHRQHDGHVDCTREPAVAAADDDDAAARQLPFADTATRTPPRSVLQWQLMWRILFRGKWGNTLNTFNSGKNLPGNVYRVLLCLFIMNMAAVRKSRHSFFRPGVSATVPPPPPPSTPTRARPTQPPLRHCRVSGILIASLFTPRRVLAATWHERRAEGERVHCARFVAVVSRL